MLVNTVLQSVAICVGVVLLSSANASESQVLLDEFAVSWQGDGQLRASKDDHGKVVLHCECRGDVRVSNEQFQAHAKRLVFDSAEQSLLLEGDVKLKVLEGAGQLAAGEVCAERVTLRIAEDQVLIDTCGAKLIGTVRLREKRD